MPLPRRIYLIIVLTVIFLFLSPIAYAYQVPDWPNENLVDSDWFTSTANGHDYSLSSSLDDDREEIVGQENREYIAKSDFSFPLGDSDGDVDALDWNEVLVGINTYFDIFDYNSVVGNFGQSELPKGQYFTVSVVDESFCMYTTNEDTINLAKDNYFGLNNNFPIGNLVFDSGGFNYGYGGLPGDKYWREWNWHIDSDGVVMTEAAIEVCDGLPSHVEYGILESNTYCPWTGKVTALGCEAVSLLK